MRVIESERGVSVVEDLDAKGHTIYRVMRGNDPLVPSHSMQDMLHLAKVIRPQRVTCSKCKQTDIDSFPADVGIGQFRVMGIGGWLKERFFGGVMDHQDILFCPDCVKKIFEEA